MLLVLSESPPYVACMVTVPDEDPVNATEQLPLVRAHEVLAGSETAPVPVANQVTVPVGE